MSEPLPPIERLWREFTENVLLAKIPIGQYDAMRRLFFFGADRLYTALQQCPTKKLEETMEAINDELNEWRNHVADEIAAKRAQRRAEDATRARNN